MDARITEKHDVAATIEITVPVDVVDATFERVFGALARQVRVPGFRPGKAPRGVLLQRVGADALAEEVRDALVDEHYPRAVRELDLTPVHAHFHAETPVAGAAFTFTVHADLYPEFTLADPDGIVLDTVAQAVGDEDVTGTVERLREDHATLLPVDRPVAAGDVVYVETLGEGGGSSMPVDLDRTEPELAAQLLGKAVGDEVVLDLGADPTAEPSPPAAPEGAEPSEDAADAAAAAAEPSEDAANAAAAPAEPPHRELAVRVTDVKEKERPELDDAFAATLGFATWAEVEAEVRRQLTAEREREAFSAQREELVEKLMAATEVALPAALVRRRQTHLLEDLARDLQGRNLTFEGYLERLEADGKREEFEAELLSAAERGVKRDLVLERLLEAHGAPLDDAEFEEALRQLARRERMDVARLERERGDEWLENYRFLLARDRALEAVVRAKTGGAAPSDAAPTDAPEAAADGAAPTAEGEPAAD
ncbi:MAG: trigger factor [Trueperaceae bacterium]|nr:trigger factor [Trueperaceae bacterium]